MLRAELREEEEERRETQGLACLGRLLKIKKAAYSQMTKTNNEIQNPTLQ